MTVAIYYKLGTSDKPTQPVAVGHELRSSAVKRSTPLRRTPFKRKPARRGPMNPDLRDAVFKRDHWRCQAHPRDFALDLPCAGRLHAHHVVLRSQGGRDEMDHLLTLCALHHDHAHNVDRHGAELAGIIRR